VKEQSVNGGLFVGLLKSSRAVNAMRRPARFMAVWRPLPDYTIAARTQETSPSQASRNRMPE
jgi:hypothetical protein